MSGFGRAVGGLFGGGNAPAAQPVPVAPTNNDAAVRAAEQAALAEQKARGRASTMAAGEDEAATAQYGRGLLKRTQRMTASSGLLG